MGKKIKRIPRNYDGKRPTGRQLKNLLPDVMDGFEWSQGPKKEEIFRVFDELIGPKMSPMARPTDFASGVLFVSVKNSSLYSILKTQQKHVLLKKLQERLPAIEIHNIVFRIGAPRASW